MDEGTGTGESGQEGWAGVRLCNLAAQSALATKGSVQAGGGEGTNRAGIRTVRDYLLQAVQDTAPGRRAGDRDGGLDAGHRQVPRLLPRDDLCRLPSGCKPRK